MCLVTDVELTHVSLQRKRSEREEDLDLTLFEKPKKRNRSSEARMLYKKTNQMGFFFFPVKPH